MEGVGKPVIREECPVEDAGPDRNGLAQSIRHSWQVGSALRTQEAGGLGTYASLDESSLR